MMDQDLYVELALADRLQWPLDRVLALNSAEIVFRMAQVDLAKSRAGGAR